MKLSDYVVKFFEEQKVKDVFMVSGGGCMHLVDSFGKSKKIKYYCTHHEQAAGMAAEAYAKEKNDLSITLVTSGPGATNTITAVAGAYQDSTPCVFISGQSKRKQTVINSNLEGLRQFGVQEINIIPIVESITKFCVTVNKPEKIKYYLEKAVYLAKNGRPGPVWLDIPLDVQSSFINETTLVGFTPEESAYCVKTLPSNEEMEYVMQALKIASRPVIIAGHGIRLSQACAELEQFVSKNHLPVVTPIMGIDVLSTDNIHNIGRVGTKGTRAGNFAMQNADLIIAIGTRLCVSVVGHEYELFARNAKVIVIDIDTVEHKKNTIHIEKEINCDAKKFLKQALTLQFDNTTAETFCAWLCKCDEWKQKYPVCLPEYENDETGINYYKFVDVLSQYATAEMPIISDAGSAFYVVSQAVNLKQNQRYVTSGALATMGFGVPAAIGVCAATENKVPVISVTGDGSFQQNIQELSVLTYNGMPGKIFVMNNNGYFSIKKTQERFFCGNYVGESTISGVNCADTKKICEAYGVEYAFAESIEELKEILTSKLNTLKPTVFEIKVSETQAIIPTNSSTINEAGIMISKPLEDMFPFLERKEFLANMFIPPVNE